MRHRFRAGRQAAAPCPRCTVPAEGACRWCGHDPVDDSAVNALEARHHRLLVLRQDRSARRAWLEEAALPAFVSCPACRQRTEVGLCEHCHFDTTDEVAAAAIVIARTHRRTVRSHRRASTNPPRRVRVRGAGCDGETIRFRAGGAASTRRTRWRSRSWQRRGARRTDVGRSEAPLAASGVSSVNASGTRRS